jgi:hypothetical protein
MLCIRDRHAATTALTKVIIPINDMAVNIISAMTE